jgi:hypothetical protein
VYDSRVSISLVILGCGERKKLTSRLLPAIDRYDGPVFRVLRKHARDEPQNSADACILSARFGLIRGTLPIPRYDFSLLRADRRSLQNRVDRQFKRALDSIQPDRLFVSVGHSYWPLLAEAIARDVAPGKLAIATGGIGGRASQLAHWLRQGKNNPYGTVIEKTRGEATLLGTTVCASRVEVLQKAARASFYSPSAAHRFETWYVAVGDRRVAPKWLVSLLFDKPVSRFRTSDARRILSLFGVNCIYASNY